MTHSKRHPWPSLVFLIAGCASSSLQGKDEDNTAVHGILKDRCYRCHGIEETVPGLQILKRDVLIQERRDETPWVSPGSLEDSLVWKRIDVHEDMPPDLEDLGGLPQEERTIIRDWILSGAPAFEPAKKREFIPESAIFEAIAEDLFNAPNGQVTSRRYLTLTHLHNNPSIGEEELMLHQIALSKAVNSMSRDSEIHVPSAIDEQKTIFRIDIEDMKWGTLNWFDVVKAYPYAVKPLADAKSVRYFEKIEKEQGASFDGIAYIRADWFVHTATRPPLYHALLGIPETLKEMREDLNVNIMSDLKRGRAKRAGLFKSGVSNQNRVVDYTTSKIGDYWISYDFKAFDPNAADEENSRARNIAQFPLGPKADNEFNRVAFQPDGSEIIFELANGLDGYMIVDREGNRINEAPVDIVYDVQLTSGSPLIVNGVSCMNCHHSGTINLFDDVREGHAVFSASAMQKIADVYLPREEMDKTVLRARQRYLAALNRAVSDFLPANVKITDLPEPVSRVSRLYDKNLSSQDVASELFLEPKSLEVIIGTRPFQELGLGPLRNPGGSIKREFWATEAKHNSTFQETVSRRGTHSPVN